MKRLLLDTHVIILMENPYWGIAVDLSLVFRAKCDRGAE